ncbi:hypothetical protein BH18ACT13_BH18ACT13_18070 [soil metagenome]
MSIDPRDGDAGERVRDAVADPLERREIAADSRSVAGRRVDENLTQPEIEPRKVDLRGRPVRELEIEGGLDDVESGVASPL